MRKTFIKLYFEIYRDMRELSDNAEMIYTSSDQKLISMYNTIVKGMSWTPSNARIIILLEKELRRRRFGGTKLIHKGEISNVYQDYRNVLFDKKNEVFLVGRKIHAVRKLDDSTTWIEMGFPGSGGTIFYHVMLNRIKTNMIFLSDFITDSEAPILLNFEHELPQTTVSVIGVNGYVLLKFRPSLYLMGIDYLIDMKNKSFTLQTQSKTLILFPVEMFNSMSGIPRWFDVVRESKDNKFIYN